MKKEATTKKTTAKKAVKEVKPTEVIDSVEEITEDTVTTEVTESPVEIAEIPVLMVSKNPPSLLHESNKPITVLIPYLRSEAAGEELKFALRSWENSFKEDFRVVVIGDREDWFSDKVVHIPHERSAIHDPERRKEIINPQADVAQKLFTAIAAGEVEGKFILSNDDIFLFGKQDLSIIELTKTFNTLETSNGRPGGLYRENALRTAKLLRANGKPTVRYGTHTPVVLDAEKLAEVLQVYRCVEQGTLVTSLYFNHFHSDVRGRIQVTGGKECGFLASVYRTDPDLKVLEEAIKTRYYINCNSMGWDVIKPFLEREYPNPSKFEG